MKYTVTVKKSYVQEFDVYADDVDEARRTAIEHFDPKEAEVFSVDVYGLSPWDTDSPLEDILHDQYKQRELDGD